MTESKNSKLFNSYVFLTTFSRNLLEVFVGTILYKLGFTLKEVIFYYLLVNIFSFILAIPCTHISKKYSNKFLSILGIISFLLLQLVLNLIKKKMIYLYITAFLFALYRRAYWIARRYYTMQILVDKNNIASNYSIIAIINQLGVIVSAYFGSILLQFFSIKIITLISIILLTISILLLYMIKFEYEKNDVKINLFETIKCTPKSSMINIACYEMQNIIKFLFPLYLIIYVKDTYTTIGIVNLMVNIASLIFTYIYGKVINKKRNFLKFSIILFLLIKVFEVNTEGIVLMVLSVIEVFSARMYEQSFHKEHFKLSKAFEYANYNYMYEMTMNFSRTILVLILYLFVKDVKIMLYITALVMLSSLLFNFKTNPIKKNSSVIWKE